MGDGKLVWKRAATTSSPSAVGEILIRSSSSPSVVNWSGTTRLVDEFELLATTSSTSGEDSDGMTTSRKEARAMLKELLGELQTVTQLVLVGRQDRSVGRCGVLRVR